MAEPKKKPYSSRLQIKIMLSLLAVILLSQSISAVVLYFSTERDIISKRNEDMKGIMSSFANSFSTVSYTEYLNGIVKKAYEATAPKYFGRMDEMNPGSPLLYTYLEEYSNKEKEISGMSMSRYGTQREIIHNAIVALGTPSYSKYLYYGFVDTENDMFVVAVGDYDEVTYGFSQPSEDVASFGYFFEWSTYSEYIDPETNSFIGVEIQDPVKGRIYASAQKLAVADHEIWVITETDHSYFSKQMHRFMMTFAWSSIVMAIVVFVSLAFLLHFIFIRRLNRLSTSTQDAVEDIKQGRFVSHFEYLKKTYRVDELIYLNNSLHFFEEELGNYVENLKNAVSKEEKAKAELLFSSQIQLSSLPSVAIDDEVITLHPKIKLAKEVGGDFYDYFYIDEHRFVFFIGDVSGKGVPAALFMMKGNTMLRTYFNGQFALSERVQAINDALSKDNPMSLFITAFVGLVDTRTHTLTYVNCGHEEAFVKQGDTFVRLQEASNLPLGVMDSMTFEEGKIDLQPGDRFFLYTDGVSEAENIKGEFFGKDRIEKRLNEIKDLPSQELLESMMATVDDFQKGKDQADDICMLSFDYRCPWLIMDNKIEELDRAESYIDSSVTASNNEEAIALLRVSLDELLTNVLSYAYQDSGKVYFSIHDDKKNHCWNCSIVDYGVAFNPLLSEPNKNVAEVPGGLGILIAKESLDSIDYRRFEKYNILTFTKKYE